MTENKKEYIGDSVYAEYDDYGVWLTTNNGYGDSNKIYLEDRVFYDLKQYWDRMTKPEEDDLPLTKIK